jgi:methylmalonyl-CoA mutase
MGEQQKPNGFEPASHEAWLKLVERDLQGAPFDKKLVKRVAGVQIAPLYDRPQSEPHVGLPGFQPYTRGSWALGGAEMGWDVRPEVAHADPAQAAQVVLDDLNGGATSLALKLDHRSRSGGAEVGSALSSDGIVIENLDDLDTVLEHASLERVPVSLEGGARGPALAALLLALSERRKTKLTVLHGSLGLDPLGTLAAYGRLPTSLARALEHTAAFAAHAHTHAPGLRAVAVDTGPYHDAGADAGHEVAIALATGLAYLRALTAAGLSVDAAAKQIAFRFSIGRDFFVEIAKLRAARLTWCKVVAACGGSAEAQAMVIHARTSLRTKTQRDPWVNMLRGTAESFAAAVGGADAITTSAYDVLIGESDEVARRLARNTQHLLRHESNVHRVVDSAGGSFYIEAITDELARKAWLELQALEKAGGLAQALSSGTLQKQLAQALDVDRKAVETRKLAITGVNEFANVKESVVQRSHGEATARTALAQASAEKLAHIESGSAVTGAIAALAAGHTLGAVTDALGDGAPEQVSALVQERLAQPFESLRDTADRYLATHAVRPRVFLANLGPIPEHKARASFAQNLFESAGFEVLTNDGFADGSAAARAFADSGASMACLCASDSVYALLAHEAARALAEHKPAALVLAGSPGDKEASYRANGVTDFIFAGMNAYASLRSLLERAGAV